MSRAVLFGSYEKGTATKKSDVDLLVDSGLRGLQFVGFLYDVQRAVGKEVDLLEWRIFRKALRSNGKSWIRG